MCIRLRYDIFESHNLCDCPEGATVAPLTDNVWENYNFENVISHDLYIEVTLDIDTYKLCKI